MQAIFPPYPKPHHHQPRAVLVYIDMDFRHSTLDLNARHQRSQTRAGQAGTGTASFPMMRLGPTPVSYPWRPYVDNGCCETVVFAPLKLQRCNARQLQPSKVPTELLLVFYSQQRPGQARSSLCGRAMPSEQPRNKGDKSSATQHSTIFMSMVQGNGAVGHGYPWNLAGLAQCSHRESKEPYTCP